MPFAPPPTAHEPDKPAPRPAASTDRAPRNATTRSPASSPVDAPAPEQPGRPVAPPALVSSAATGAPAADLSRNASTSPALAEVCPVSHAAASANDARLTPDGNASRDDAASREDDVAGSRDAPAGRGDGEPAAFSAAADSRVIAAYEAALAVMRELTPDAVLQRIVDLARQVVPAKYAALGVADSSGRIIQFITSGISEEQRARLGPPPRGHGLLGVLIHDAKPLLAPNIAADPRSVGFPPNHPAMTSLLGVPIMLGDRVLGDLYLTEREHQPAFDEADLAAVQVLAVHAAIAIDRAIADRRSRDQRDRLQVILDKLPSGILILSEPAGAVELANAAARAMLFGDDPARATRSVLAGEIRLHRAHQGANPADARVDIRALAGTWARNQQFVLERADGRLTPVLVQAAPLPGARGLADQAIVVLQDITGPRAAEQLKDDFLSLISHEFRTPLAAIHGGAHLLANQGQALDAESRREVLSDIVAESARLDRMLTNMLSVTEIIAGRMHANTEPVLLGPLARQAANRTAANAPNHQFLVDIPPDLPPAEGDPELLLQVLRNLYENAVKYSPAGGEIRVTATVEPPGIAPAGAAETPSIAPPDRPPATPGAGWVTLRVTDAGIGIAADQVDKVFERFHRAGADPTVRGMGLGLYLSRQFVEAQGGSMSASSPGPGQGASFAVRLPIARDWAFGEADDARDDVRGTGPGAGFAPRG